MLSVSTVHLTVAALALPFEFAVFLLSLSLHQSTSSSLDVDTDTLRQPHRPPARANAAQLLHAAR